LPITASILLPEKPVMNLVAVWKAAIWTKGMALQEVILVEFL
jgi:hypothetical protein